MKAKTLKLSGNMKVVDFGAEPDSESPAKVVFWYDRKSRNWISQLMDINGNQIGDAEYSSTKLGRDFDCKMLAKAGGVTIIEKKQ